MRFTTCFALTGGLICAGTIMAAAWPATTTGNVNVRSGPGARYSVVNSLPAGVPLDVLSCSGAWCQTQYGYVSSRLLAQNAAAPGMAGAQVMPNYPANPGTNYRQNYAPAAAGMPPAMAPTAAPYSPAQSVAPIDSATAGHAGQEETMSGARTTIGSANVRSGPGVEYDIVKTLPDFTKVEVHGCAHAWCQTDEGYISLYLLSRGPVQQVLSPAAQPRIAGSATRDSSNYSANIAGQAAMGYGAAGTGQQYTPPPYGSAAATNYAPRTTAQPMTRPYAPPIAQPGLAQAGMAQPGTNYRASYGAGYAPGAQPSAVAGTATTTATVNVRGGPGVAYNVIASLPAGTPVNVVSCSGSWCQTQYGFVSARHINQGGMAQAYRPTAPAYAPRAAAPAYAPAMQAYAPRVAGQQPVATAPMMSSTATQATSSYVTQPRFDPSNPGPGQHTENMSGARTTIGTANVRSGPGVEYSVVKTLPDFTKVEVQGCADTWCQTDEGYISLYLLSRGPVQQVLSPAAQPRIPGSATRDSSNYAANVAGQAAMGYGAAGTGQQYVPPAYGSPNLAQNPGTMYRQNYAPAAGQAARAYAPASGGQAAYGAQTYGAAAGGAAVTTATTNVRGGPGVRYGVIASLPAGTPVNVVSCAGAWCQTQYGYVSSRLLSRGGMGAEAQQIQPLQQAQPMQAPQSYARSYAPAAQTAAPAARSYAPAQPQRYAAPAQARRYTAPAQNDYASAAQTAGYSATTVADLNVRSGPGTGYDVLNTLPAGTEVDVASCSGSWCQTQYGYVSARHLSNGDADPARVVVRPSQLTGGNYSNAAYVDPAYASGGYGNAGYANAGYSNAGYGGASYGNPVYNSQGFTPGPYPVDNPLLDIAAAPFVGVAAAVTQAFGGFDGGYGWGGGNNWTASLGPQFFGPGYWGPGIRGRRAPSYWGARPSYWGGRPTYWNIHPGYRTYSNFGDRNGDMYWSRRNEGRRPQAASWYGNRGVGPYGMRPSYRPLLWQPRAGIF